MKKRLLFTAILTLALICTSAVANAQITGGTMKMGTRGSNVTALQQLLSTNRDIYPAGMVTGYYGPLTHSAVVQFQLHYNLAADGIAGPATIGKMNSVIAMGRGLDIYAPQIANVKTSSNGRVESISFNSNEPVRAYVYYDTNGLMVRDSGASFTAPMVSGTAVSTSTYGTSNTVTTPTLNSNTNYNYMVLAVDQSGNWNVYSPGTFRSGS
jgi:peptidoglycan hydrolase-like protein with peptidoglycan-binding domain